ncbi:MAG: hypothetical protein ACYC5K_05980 [Saccharofermentanales bacterium]
MTSLTKREVTLLVVLFIAISGAIYYNFVLKPYLADKEAMDIEMTDSRTAINEAKLKKASIKMVEDKMAVIQEDMDQKLATVLDSIDRPAIIVLLDKTLFPEASNSVFTFLPDYQELGSNYITTAEITFDCTPDEFLEILSRLRAAIPVSRVATSSLRKLEDDTGDFEAMITLEVLTRSITPTNTEFNYK